MNKLTILIADDHRLIRETLGFILNRNPRFRVIANCGCSKEAIEKVRELKPDLILMDVNIKPYSGIEATAKICSFSNTPVIGISMHSDPVYAQKMIKTGARGYITKNSPSAEMFAGIEAVIQGKRYICEEVKNIMTDNLLQQKESGNGVAQLTRREIEIIHFIKEGFSSKEIANALYLSCKTVEVHRYNILKKLNLPRTSALIQFVSKYEDYLFSGSHPLLTPAIPAQV